MTVSRIAARVAAREAQTRKAFRERWWPQFYKACQSAPRWLVLLFLAVCFWGAVLGLWGVPETDNPAALAMVLATIAIFAKRWWSRLRKWWQSAQRWLSKNYVQVVFFLAVAVCVWGLWIGLGRVPGEVSGLLDALEKSTKSSDETRSIITALAAVLATIAIFGTIIVQSIGVWTRERQTTTIQEGHVTDRLTKAIEQLGAEKSVKRVVAKNLDGEELHNESRGVPLVVETTEPNLEVRLGAIYALERIAQDSERDHGTIMEILCAYVRENAKAQDTPATPIGEPEHSDDAGSLARHVAMGHWLESLPDPRVDVQAALTVVGRRADHRIAAERLPLDLRRTNQRKANLTGARLERAILELALLERANLAGARLKGANLTGARLEGAKLIDARLEGAKLIDARLEGADLTAARLERADLTAARLEATTLMGARLERAILIGARLEGANLTVAQLEGAIMDLARLKGANLAGARLKGANLAGARLEGANLLQAELERAKLIDARLEGADLRHAALKGADLTGAQLQGANLSEARLEGANLTGAQLQRANLSGARLKGANLTGTRLEGAILDGADFG